jgi:TPR repeat protein
MTVIREDAEFAYRAWLEAAARAAGSRTALNSEIAKRLPRIPGIDARIRGWTNPKTLKLPLDNGSDEAADAAAFQVAIVDTVAQLGVIAPNYSTSEKTFAGILKLVNDLRVGNQKHGQKIASASSSLYDSGFLSIPVVTAENLDLERLNLGSAKFEGAVPPYILRDFDSRCIELMNDPSVDVITLTGAPKVGKTRSLVANLQSSLLKKHNVYWIRPGRAFDVLAKTLKRSDKASTLIVIDDLQRWGSELREFSIETISKLAACAKIIVTVHKADFTRWRTSHQDHSSRIGTSPYGQDSLGLTYEVISFLEKSLISVEAQLSRTEEEIARVLAPEFSTTDLRNLGSFFSSTEFLESKLAVLRDSAEPMSVAMVQALIDTHILFPDGFTVDTLKASVEFALERTSPQAYFSFSRFEALLADELTRGASETSPHSILQRQPESRDFYFLFDPLWVSLRPLDWSAPSNFINDQNLEDMALTIAQAGFLGEALRVLEERPNPASASFGSLIGQICFDLGKLDEAKEWCEISSKLGDNRATFLLAFMLEKAQPELAMTLYRDAADSGHELAMYNLALRLEQSDRKQAMELYERAADLGVASAFFNLGILNYSANPAKALESFSEAAALGSPGAYHNMGCLYQDLGNLEDAIKNFRLAAEQGDAPSMLNLGLLLWNSNAEEAESYYRRAIDQGLQSAMLNLGSNLMDSDPVESRRLLEQALAAGHPKAKFALAMLLIETEPGVANSYLRESADEEDSQALLWLGNELVDSDIDKSIEYLTRASELKEPEAMYNLAWILEGTNADRAKELYAEAAISGYPEAKFNLAIMLAHENSEKAMLLARECIAAGMEDAEELLADIINETQGNSQSQDLSREEDTLVPKTKLREKSRQFTSDAPSLEKDMQASGKRKSKTRT